MVLGKFPLENSDQKKSHRSPPPLENSPIPGNLPPRKFSLRIFPPISLTAFLHLTLCFDKFSQT